MIQYNIYYNNNKINARPLTTSDIQKIKNHEYIYKKNGKLQIKIPVNKCCFRKLYII